MDLTCVDNEYVVSGHEDIGTCELSTVFSAGKHATCAGTSETVLDCYGALTDPGTVTGAPASVFKYVSIGYDAACGILGGMLATGEVQCWGYSGADGVEWGDFTSTLEMLDVGLGFACGIDAAGAVECIGQASAQGQLD